MDTVRTRDIPTLINHNTDKLMKNSNVIKPLPKMKRKNNAI